MGRGSHAGHAPVLFVQHVADFLGREFFQTGLDECANDAAAHFVEETLAFDDEGDERAAALYLALRERSSSRFPRIARVGGKGAEIVRAKKGGGGAAHDAQLQGPGHVPRRMAQQGVHGGMVPDKVAVLFAGRIEPGMEIGPNTAGAQYADVLGQPGVEGEQQFA